MSIWQLSTLLFFLTTIMYFGKAREYKQDKQSLEHQTTLLMNYNKVNDSLCIRHCERSLKYQIIAFELNEITNMFQISKREKRSRLKLIEMMSSL